VEANGQSATQEIPHLLLYPKIHYLKPNLDPVLGQINPLYTLTLLSSNIAFNIMPPVVPACLEWSLPSGFSKENVHIYLEELRQMRKPSGVIAGRLAESRAWDLAEGEYQVPATTPQHLATLCWRNSVK
jgi:hypothetical protein